MDVDGFPVPVPSPSPGSGSSFVVGVTIAVVVVVVFVGSEEDAAGKKAATMGMVGCLARRDWREVLVFRFRG